MDTRGGMISTIDALFPIDSSYEQTNQIGRELLIETIEEVGWRNLPDEFLRVLESKCRGRENYESHQSEQRWNNRF